MAAEAKPGNSKRSGPEIRVQVEDFDPGQELQRLTQDDTGIGAVVSFVGLVRDFADQKSDSSMTLEHYPGMTERQIMAIAEQAWQRWPLNGCLVVHRHGRLLPGDRIVLVIAASPHRKAAFEACEFLIDWLKTKAPFWKLEQSGAMREWVESRGSDDDAAARWNK